MIMSVLSNAVKALSSIIVKISWKMSRSWVLRIMPLPVSTKNIDNFQLRSQYLLNITSASANDILLGVEKGLVDWEGIPRGKGVDSWLSL